VNVFWSRALAPVVKCDFALHSFPFDEQVCDIPIGCQASSRRFIELIPQPMYTETEHLHTAEFNVTSIEVVMLRSTSRAYAEQYDEIHYRVRLRRYPNYYVITFILPMMAISLLATGTMWMSRGNVGQRVNSGSKILLSVLSIEYITAQSRPPMHGDIWLDIFQSHCLVLSMASVTESLVIDYISRWYSDRLIGAADRIFRTVILAFGSAVFYADCSQVGLLTHLREDPTKAASVLWLFVVSLLFLLYTSTAISVGYALYKLVNHGTMLSQRTQQGFQLLTDREGSYPQSLNGTAKSHVGTNGSDRPGPIETGTPPQATSPSPGSP
jgi:hypothetical protein